MKRLLYLLSAVIIGFGLLPAAASAMESDDKELEAFLEDIGWEKQDYINYLESKDWYLDDFESTDELGTPLTEESIQPVLQDFELSREELNALLIENGDIEKGQDVLEGSSILFSEDLYDYVDFYINGSEGTPIEESSLQELLNQYGFKSKEELEKFLQKYDDSIENYEYIEDLELTVDYYQNGGANIDAEMDKLLNAVQLTDEELEKLFAHLETIDGEDSAFLDKLTALGDRMTAFENFDSADDLSAEQIAELLDISNSMLNLFEINTKYYLVHDGEKKLLSFDSLMTMKTTKGDDLLIEIYTKQGEFLADVLLTADMFGSELIKETGNDIKSVEKTIAKTPVKAKTVVKTVKGGKLPNTASDYMQNTLIGLAFIVAGTILFRRVRAKGM
ncbi:processed acidic surface protein [Niallia sp. 03133]|uniref:processed acidic surface protein n=1 Tax=Niallia sp. 03133 TaxID=3458060 RepID=UPI0040440D13